MPEIEIAGIKLKYNLLAELPQVVEETIGTIDEKLAKLDDESKALNNQRRQLKASLGGQETKPKRKAPETADA